MLLDPEIARVFLDALIAAFAMLGGTMAYDSGLAAVRAQAAHESPQAMAHSINIGIASGFSEGAPLAALALIIMVWP